MVKERDASVFLCKWTLNKFFISLVKQTFSFYGKRNSKTSFLISFSDGKLEKLRARELETEQRNTYGKKEFWELYPNRFIVCALFGKSDAELLRVFNWNVFDSVSKLVCGNSWPTNQKCFWLWRSEPFSLFSVISFSDG